MNKRLKDMKGITLIALVITIIVLLILAGVSLSMIASQDGILGKATKASEDNAKATDVDKVKLAVASALMNETHPGTFTYEELKNELTNNGLEEGENKDYTLSDDGILKLVKYNLTFNITTGGSV